MLVSEDGSVDVMDRQKEDVLWKHFRLLSKQSRDILISSEIATAIQRLQENFHLNDIAIGNISLFIRKIFFGELKIEECEAKIGSMLMTTNGGDPNQAKDIITFIQKEILTIQPKARVEESGEKTEPKKVTINMPLLEALSKYERLGNQLVSRERIKIKSQGEPVRPSLLYWIKYYRDELGVGHHNSVDRGNFLFRSENGAKLSPEERERVNLILKSIEESTPLSIDTEHQEVLFPEFHNTGNVSQKAPIAPSVTASPTNTPLKQNPIRIPSTTQTFSMKQSQESDDMKQTESTVPSMRIAQNHHSQAPTVNPQEVKTTDGTMSFSARHILPAEMEMLQKTKKDEEEQQAQQPTMNPVKNASEPVSSTTPQVTHSRNDDSNPFVIRPSQRNA